MSGSMPSPDMKAYFQYLRRRSLSGYLYRKLMLYPRLSKKLSGKVLDYGCGIGDFVQFRANTIGADINHHNVDYCSQRGLEAVLIEGNKIPFTDHSFDGVMLDNVLEHIPADVVDSVIEDIRRVLKTEGKMLIGVPGPKGYGSDPDHKVFYTPESLSILCARYGFEMEEIFFMPLPYENLGRVLAQFCVYAVFVRKGI